MRNRPTLNVPLCEAMNINTSTVYNNSSGNMDGHVNYGEGVAATDPDAVATEALIVSFHGHCKYPAGYFLTNKNIVTIEIFVSLCRKYGTTVKFNAMQLFGCKFGHDALGNIDVFVDHQGQKVEWKFITLLPKEQRECGLKFANNLSSKHNKFRKNKMNMMNIKIADAIEFVMCAGHPSFQNAKGTIVFIRVIIDRLFDL